MNLSVTVEGQVLRVRQLNEDIHRLTTEANSAIDAISGMISAAYMKKKTQELKKRQQARVVVGSPSIGGEEKSKAGAIIR